jgi:hypothetical protein
VLSLDGVACILVFSDLMVRRGAAGGKLWPTLLPRFGAPDSLMVRVIDEGVTTASPGGQGTHGGVVPVHGWHRLGGPRGGGGATRHRALYMLLEGNVKESPCLMEPLVGPWIQHVGDVPEVIGSHCHVVGHVGEA